MVQQDGDRQRGAPSDDMSRPPAAAPGALRLRILDRAAKWIHAPLLVVALILRAEFGQNAFYVALGVIAVAQMYMVLRARVAEADAADADGE